MEITATFVEQLKEYQQINDLLINNIENLKFKTRDELSNSEFIKIQPIISEIFLCEQEFNRFKNWQVITATYLKKYSEENLYQLFQKLTSPSEKRSLFNMILLEDPWYFTDWGYSKKNQDGKIFLYQRKNDDLYFLAELDEDSEQDEIIRNYVITGYKKKLTEIELKIQTILTSPKLIQEAHKNIKDIENKQIQEQKENLINLAVEEINHNDDFGLAIGAFLFRYSMESTLKQKYSSSLEDSIKSKTLGSVIHHLYKKRLLTIEDKDSMLKANDVLINFIHPQDSTENSYSKEDLLNLEELVRKIIKN